MLIREALKTDAPRIRRLQQQLFEENGIYGFVAETADEVEKSINSYFFVAEIEGEIVGFVSGSVHVSRDLIVIPAGENYLEIDNLYVAPEFRRAGTGGELVDRLLARAKQNGVAYSLLYSATRKIHDVLKFYERHNFQSWYVRMFQKL